MGRWFVNSSRVHLYNLNLKFSQRIEENTFVLDAGAGTAPYRDMFAHTNYETADFEMVDKEYRPSTYVCDLVSIPVKDERFDFIIFNQVMEHLPDPARVLGEFHRILKPGGAVFCTCPLFYEEHEQPYDFYRYTQFAHKHLFESSGFEIESIEWVEGYLGTVAYQMETAYRYLPSRPSQLGGGIVGCLAGPILLVTKLACVAMAGLLYRLDTRTKFTQRGYPKNYAVVATKQTTPTNGDG